MVYIGKVTLFIWNAVIDYGFHVYDVTCKFYKERDKQNDS
jgi:hypothetical protein